MHAPEVYDYAIVRVVPRVEREEFINAGVILSCQRTGFLQAAIALDEARLRQLKQRIVLRCELTPLSLKDTAAYISARVKTAGGEATRLFTRDAVIAIHQRSGGIPRVISVICDNALVNGFAADQKPVGASIIHEVSRTLALADTPAPPVPMPPPAPEPAVAAEAPMFATVGRRRFSFF